MASSAKTMNPGEIWLLRAVHPANSYSEESMSVRAYARHDLLKKALRSELRIGGPYPCPHPERWQCFRIDLETMTVEPLTHEQVL